MGRFLENLTALGVPFVHAPVGGDEFTRPGGYTSATADGNAAARAAHKADGGALLGLGGAVAIIDVDTKNGADVTTTRQAIEGAGVQIYAEVSTPSGGAHFYTAGHPELISVAATKDREGLLGLPGVEVLAHRRNAFLPGTARPRYDGRGYRVVFNDLGTLVDGGDEDSAENLLAFVEERRVAREQAPGRDAVDLADIIDAPQQAKDELGGWLDGAERSFAKRCRTLANADEGEIDLGNGVTGTWESPEPGLLARTAARAMRLDMTCRALGRPEIFLDIYRAAFEGLTNRKDCRLGLSKISARNRAVAARKGPAVPKDWEEKKAVARFDSSTSAPRPAAKPVPLAEAHEKFTRWLGEDYDLDALDVTLAAAAVERLDGDPVWVLVISGSGNAKTETVQTLTGIGATLVSTITSEGALLSATSKKERSQHATGGLLRQVGDRGVLVVKDVTSILSMQRDQRAQVLGALREIYDGRWTRTVGTDGGNTLEWTGRLVLIGAVTTAWDKAHAVIASMGDRFVLVRMDSTKGRAAAGRRAIGNTGHEKQMREELAATVAGVLAGMNTTPIEVTDAETEILLAAADLVTLARTGVEYDYRGDVVDAHAPEMPTRFAKQLSQVLRGAAAIGHTRQDGLRLAIRCARDSVPPLRLAIIDDLAEHPDSTTADVRKRLGLPRATVDRQLQALHMLGVLTVDEEDYERGGEPRVRWRYSIASDIDPLALSWRTEVVPEMSVHPPIPLSKGGEDQATPRTLTDISGTTETGDPCPSCGGERSALRAAGGLDCLDCHHRARKGA